MKKNKDGSVTLYVGPKAPNGSKYRIGDLAEDRCGLDVDRGVGPVLERSVSVEVGRYMRRKADMLGFGFNCRRRPGEDIRQTWR